MKKRNAKRLANGVSWEQLAPDSYPNWITVLGERDDAIIVELRIKPELYLSDGELYGIRVYVANNPEELEYSERVRNVQWDLVEIPVRLPRRGKSKPRIIRSYHDDPPCSCKRRPGKTREHDGPWYCTGCMGLIRKP